MRGVKVRVKKKPTVSVKNRSTKKATRKAKKAGKKVVKEQKKRIKKSGKKNLGGGYYEF